MSVTTALIAIIVVILFVMLMLSMNNKLFKPSANTQDLKSQEELTEQLRAETNAERARNGLAPLPEGAVAARTMANRLRRDATDLAALTIRWQTELETKNKALTDQQSQITALTDNAQRLYAQISALQAKLDQNAGAESLVITLRNDLQIAQNQLLTYQKQLSEAQGRPSADAMALIRAQLDESQAANQKLAQQVDALLEQSKGAVNQAKYDELAAELARIRPEYNRQRYIIQQLQTELDKATLFIEKEKDLPAIATKLYARLKTLDNLSGEALTKAYEQIEVDLNARIVHLQSFATGSSEVTLDREKMIRAAATLKSKPNSFFLVVGYASTTGTYQTNYDLSRKRATTTASVVNTLKKPQQTVKAVFLGQTNRFDKSNPLKNQICEIWEIDRK